MFEYWHEAASKSSQTTRDCRVHCLGDPLRGVCTGPSHPHRGSGRWARWQRPGQPRHRTLQHHGKGHHPRRHAPHRPVHRRKPARGRGHLHPQGRQFPWAPRPRAHCERGPSRPFYLHPLRRVRQRRGPRGWHVRDGHAQVGRKPSGGHARERLHVQRGRLRAELRRL